MGTSIKGLLFDYGGTLDTNGKHWATVLWDLYGVYAIDISRDQFYEAYVFAERELGTKPHIEPDFDFQQVLGIKITLQFEYLKAQGIALDESLIASIVSRAYRLASETVEYSKPLLEAFHGRIPMVMVSNFYGNLQTVLKDFGIHHYFDTIVESAVVGVRKPDAAIYQLGVDALGLPAENCLVIGDSYTKDMGPGKACGCQTLWLRGADWNPDKETNDVSAADQEIYDVLEVKTVVEKYL